MNSWVPSYWRPFVVLCTVGCPVAGGLLWIYVQRRLQLQALFCIYMRFRSFLLQWGLLPPHAGLLLFYKSDCALSLTGWSGEDLQGGDQVPQAAQGQGHAGQCSAVSQCAPLLFVLHLSVLLSALRLSALPPSPVSPTPYLCQPDTCQPYTLPLSALHLSALPHTSVRPAPVRLPRTSVSPTPVSPTPYLCQPYTCQPYPVPLSALHLSALRHTSVSPTP